MSCHQAESTAPNPIMDCINCFAAPRPSTNSRHNDRQLRLSHLAIRDRTQRGRAASRCWKRPPTPYPHQVSFAGEPRTYQTHTRRHNLYIRPRTVESVTVVRQPRARRGRAVIVEIERRSSRRASPTYDNSFSDRDTTETAVRIRRRRKSVSFQEQPFQNEEERELRERIAIQNDRINRRPVREPQPPKSILKRPADDLSKTLSNLRLSPDLKQGVASFSWVRGHAL